MTVPFRYRRLVYIAVDVTDIERSAAFVTDIVGLDPAGSASGGERFFRCSTDHHNLVLQQAAEPGYRRSCWELESEADVDAAFRHFTEIGLQPRWVADEERAKLGLSMAPAFRVREPHSGGCFEYCSMIRQTAIPFSRRVVNIARFGHFALNVPDCRQATRFFIDRMGFLVSDYVGDYAVSLMRAFPNPLHHTLGIGQSRTGKAGVNHINFMVTDIDDIGRTIYRLKKHGIEVVFGPGRHPTSGSIFIYFLCPDGMTWEYSFGMELFPEKDARPARAMSAAPVDFDLWGAMPEPKFASAGGIKVDV